MARRRKAPQTRASAVTISRADGSVEVRPAMKPRQLQRHLEAQDRRYGAAVKSEAIQSWKAATSQDREDDDL